MDRLPTEIISLIFEAASTGDRQTAYQLCLVSQSVSRLATPILYRHIYLNGTAQVKRINATIKMSPHLGDLIHGMTLHDEEISPLTTNYINEFLFTLDRSEGWIDHWKKLIQYMGVLSRSHHLKTLVVTTGGYRRLSYHRNDGTLEGRKGHLAEQLRKSNLQLNHLLISHADLVFTLTKFSMKKLTWYGCETQFTMGSFGFDEKETIPIRSKDLRAAEYMIGDNFHEVHDVKKNQDTTSGDNLSQAWMEALMSQMHIIDKTQSKTPEFSVYLHCNTQEARKKTIDKLKSCFDLEVKVGLWGNSSHKNQRQAEMESFTSKGWIQREICALNYGESKNRYKCCVQGTLPKRTLWCGCMDIGRLITDTDDEEEDYSDDDVDDD